MGVAVVAGARVWVRVCVVWHAVNGLQHSARRPAVKTQHLPGRLPSASLTKHAHTPRPLPSTDLPDRPLLLNFLVPCSPPRCCLALHSTYAHVDVALRRSR